MPTAAQRRRLADLEARLALGEQAANGDPAAEVVAGLPEWHAGQQRIVDQIEAGLRFLVLFWARQTGKTTLCAALAAKWLAEGKTGAYFAWTTQYVDEVFEAIVEYLGGEDGPLVKKCDRNKMIIRTTTGGYLKVWALHGGKPDAGRGAVNHFVIYEEAGLIPNLKHHFYNTITATLATHEGIALFNGNAKVRGDFNDFHERAKNGKGGWATSLVKSHENPHGISHAELERLRVEYEEEGLEALYDMEYRAIPIRDFGAPFAAVMNCLMPAMSERDPVAAGWDYGEMQDMTLGYFLDAMGDVCKRVDAKADHGAQDSDEIEDVIYRETGNIDVSFDATGVGKTTFNHLEKRSIRDGRMRPYTGSPDQVPSGGVPQKIVGGACSIYEGVNFSETRKQEIYGGIRRFLMKRMGRIPEDSPLVEALLSAVYVENTRDTGPRLKIVVAHGPKKDEADAYGLAIRAWLRSDRSPVYPELHSPSDDALQAEIARQREIERQVREQVAEQRRARRH